MPDDRAELDELMARFLRAVSFEEGGRPSYAELNHLFVDGARLINATPDPAEIATLEEFIRVRDERVSSGALTWFEEVESAQATEVFGDVAQRWSTYRKRGAMEGTEIDARGVIATQFVRTGEGWRMTAMAWDDERPGVELPAGC
jgi:hypothetical protein